MNNNAYPSPQQQPEASLVSNVMDSKSALCIIAWDVLAYRMKRSCGAFVTAAQFSGGRKQEQITALTGVNMVDFDHMHAICGSEFVPS